MTQFEPERTARPDPLPPSIAWHGDDGGALLLLDQTRLPHERHVLEVRALDGVLTAIRRLCVRGAPAIGVAAAYGLFLGVRERRPEKGELLACADEVAHALRATRPTAVNLHWALDRCLLALRERPRVETLLAVAQELHRDDAERCRRIGAHGAPLVPDGARIATHCNTGRLATAGDGTALAVLFQAHRQGRRIAVIADETRPLLQGSRLTALELAVAGIPVQVVADGASPGLVARGEIDLAIVGADRIARNGDFANKVGTYPLALACAARRVPFYVAAPLSTFDPAVACGSGIPIEERSGDEVLQCGGVRFAPAGVMARNPAFDVTPADLVTAFVTDGGVLRPPYPDAIKAALADSR